MAPGRRLTLALVALLARAALAADPCQEGRVLTGVAVTAGAEGLSIAAVDEGTPAADGGLRAGDRLVQANAIVLTSCDAWARAVRDARRERKALLLLVRREAGEVPLMLAQAVWDRAVAVAPAVPPPTVAPAAPADAAAPAPTVPVAPSTATAPSPQPAPSPAPTAPPAPPAPTAAPAPAPPRPAPRPIEAPSVAAIVKEPPAAGAPSPLVEDLLREIETLAPEEPSRARIGTYQQQLLRVHRQIETVAARAAASPQVITGLRTVVRYFDAAEVAWEADEEQRERDKRPRHIPSSEGTAAPYFMESDAEATIFEFPFLRSTVVREPGTGTIEVSGLWRPVQARTLLWEKGREELGRLAAWVRSGS